MAVYKRSYQRYEGLLTAKWRRFLVIPRYALAEMRESRFLTLFFFGSLIFPLLCALFIYLHYNLSAMEMLRIRAARLNLVDSRFFLTFTGFQGMLAFMLASFIGPGLISPDLANSALPLYLARPFSRAEYVLGKLSVIWLLLSAITWAPGLLLFWLQAQLAGNNWAGENSRIAAGIFFGSWIWILFLSLLAVALSAWVKWKPVAGALIFGVFILSAAFAGAINLTMDTRWGHLMNISHLVGSIWVSLFERPLQRGEGALFFRVAPGEEIPVWACWVSLGVLCALCLWLLEKRIKGAEVVR